VPKLLGKADAWAGYCDAERPLLDAAKKLLKEQRVVRGVRARAA
jgi:hypothetical protein